MKPKRRRLSLRQAIHCELGLPLVTMHNGQEVCRCRCGGSRRGARRCNLVKPTRWCFAALDPSDPHYIPPQRRRISPRTAVSVLTVQIKRMERRGEFAAAETLRGARRLASQTARDERVAREKKGIDSRKRDRFPLHAARVLQSGLEWLAGIGGDIDAQLMLASAKLEVLR